MSVPVIGAAVPVPAAAAAASSPAGAGQGLLPFMLLLPEPTVAPEPVATGVIAAEAEDQTVDPPLTVVDEATPLIGWLFDSFAAAGEVATNQDAVKTMPDMRLPTPATVRIDARLQSAFVDGAEVMPRDPEPLPSPSSSLPSLAAPLFAPELPPEPLPPATFAASLSSPLVAQHAAVAATSVASSTSPAPPLVLHADGPDLSADLGERISWQLQQGLGEATIELHPAELGALTIRIETQAQQAQVHILAAEPAARALISQCLPQLRELLGASGLTLTRGQVESAERRGGQLGTGSDGLLSPRGARRRVTSVTLVDTYA